ncbi:MAG: hypothetical protein ABI321_01635 [Polyangia bacterium]
MREDDTVFLPWELAVWSPLLQHDVAHLGTAPRAMDARMEDYIARAVRSCGWLFHRRSRVERGLRETMRNGDFVRVNIASVSIVERRGHDGRLLYETYSVEFELPSGPVHVATRDPRMGLLTAGVTEEVLWSPSAPDVVVPTFLLL